MKQIIIFLFLLGVPFIGMAQQSDFEPKGSFNIEVSLPNNTSNKAFKELMQGLVVITPHYQYTFSNTISVGGGLYYGYFNINEFKNNIALAGGLHIGGAFVKIGQEKYYGKFGLDYGVRVGYSMNYFITNKNKDLYDRPYNNDGGFIEPILGLSLMSNDNTSFKLALGYTFHNFKFQPHQVGTDQFSGFSQDDFSKISTYFSIGFGYSYYFGVNK